MRLFHVSEEPDISVFEPRPVVRRDLDPEAKYVWAIDEDHLPNFLTPRNCPRVCYRVNNRTTAEDMEKYIDTSASTNTYHRSIEIATVNNQQSYVRCSPEIIPFLCL